MRDWSREPDEEDRVIADAQAGDDRAACPRLRSQRLRGAVYRIAGQRLPDRLHFLDLIGEIVERYRVRMHAYVLMTNHDHLLIETPEANSY